MHGVHLSPSPSLVDAAETSGKLDAAVKKLEHLNEVVFFAWVLKDKLVFRSYFALRRECVESAMNSY